MWNRSPFGLHDVFHPDGTPYRIREAQILKALSGSPKRVVPRLILADRVLKQPLSETELVEATLHFKLVVGAGNQRVKRRHQENRNHQARDQACDND